MERRTAVRRRNRGWRRILALAGLAAVCAAPWGAQPAAVGAICAYQRWISPHVGDCAYRRAGGGISCSEFAKRRIRAEGAWRGLREMPGQFRRCREAARTAGLRPKAASGAEACCTCTYFGCCYDWAEEFE